MLCFGQIKLLLPLCACMHSFDYDIRAALCHDIRCTVEWETFKGQNFHEFHGFECVCESFLSDVLRVHGSRRTIVC